MIKKSIRFKLMLFFSIAIVSISTFIGVFNILVSKNTLEENARLTSLQTLQESQKGLSIYFRSLSQSVDLLTRKKELKYLEDPTDGEANLKQAIDSITAALKTTPGSVRGYYATETGKLLKVWTAEEDGKTKYKSELTEDKTFVNQEWYVNPQANVERDGVFAYYTEPYLDPETQKLIITVSQCIKARDVLVGVAAIDIEFTVVEEFVKNIQLLSTGYVQLLSPTGDILVDSDYTTLTDLSLTDTAFWQELSTKELANGDYNLLGDTYYITAITDIITGWKLFGFVSEHELDSKINLLIISTLVAIIFSICLGVLCTFIITNSMIKKMNMLKNHLSEIAQGNFSKHIDIPGNDEFHTLGENINQMTSDVSALLRNIDTASKALLDTSKDISHIESQTQEVSANTQVAMQEIANGNTSLAENTSEVRLQIEHLAGQLDNSSTYVHHVSDISTDTHNLSSKGLKMLDTLSRKSRKTKENSALSQDIFNEMAESITKINFISDAIIQITDQTSLLSLNASIEAARAGESGRGFAVVAEEIRKLSEASKKSTDEIKAIVDEINHKSSKANEAVSETQVILLEEDKAIIETQAVFTEILGSIDKLVQSLKHIDSLNMAMIASKNTVVTNTEEIAAISEESASSSEEILASTTEVENAMTELGSHTETLIILASELKQNIDHFKL